jgi:hypothetical protein
VLHSEGSYECSSGPWRTSVYQENRKNVVSYRLGAWAKPCLDQDVDYTLITTRQVMLMGIIPLRPSTSFDVVYVSPTKD